MTTISSTLPQSQWMRASLGVPEDAASPEVRRAAFDRLREASFSPPENWNEAIRMPRLESGARPSTRYFPAFHGAQRSTLRDDIESFAQRLFSMTPDERRAEWQALCQRATDAPRLHWRLRQLKPCLNVGPIPADAAPDVKQLLERLRALSVASPDEQVRLRRETLALMKGREHQRWATAAGRVESEFPRDAALDPRLIQRMIQPVPPRSQSALDLRKKLSGRESSAQARPDPAQSSGNNWLAVMIVMGGILNILRLMATSDNATLRVPTPAYQTPRYSAPQWPSRNSPLTPVDGRTAESPLTTTDLLSVLVPESLFEKLQDTEHLSISNRKLLARNYLDRVRRLRFVSNDPRYRVADVEEFLRTGIFPISGGDSPAIAEIPGQDAATASSRPSVSPLPVWPPFPNPMVAPIPPETRQPLTASDIASILVPEALFEKLQDAEHLSMLNRRTLAATYLSRVKKRYGPDPDPRFRVADVETFLRTGVFPSSDSDAAEAEIPLPQDVLPPPNPSPSRPRSLRTKRTR